MGRTACTQPQCLYSRAIPLLPLWAVRPVQSLSACTVDLYIYSPYGPYSLYSAPVPVQYSYTSTPSMGRTACTESLSACTVQLYLYSPYGPYGLYRALVPVQYSYTSTPPMGRTACTEPQCLYSRAIPLLPLRAVRPVQSHSTFTRVHFTLRTCVVADDLHCSTLCLGETVSLTATNRYFGFFFCNGRAVVVVTLMSTRVPS